MSGARLLQRPILGGVFGAGRYALATVPSVSRGLHAVRFMVIEPTAGAVLAVADGKTEALATARRVIRAADELARQQAIAAATEAGQGRLWPDEPPVRSEAPHGQRRPVSKGRREVFEKSDGRCAYCATVLTLDGRWHIEHSIPRALDGCDELVNLVAACAPCNLAKRDRTAVEFVADRAANSVQKPT